jgi:DNA-binding response OmpR family regulator
VTEEGYGLEREMRIGIRQSEEKADIYLDLDVRKVLIFNENVEELALYAEPFEAKGFEVHKCTSVESAMRCIEREELDIVLVDQSSPAFEGRRVIRHLARYNHPAPLIVLARPRDEQSCQQALELGATEYLEKPVPTSKLNAIIQDFFKEFLERTRWRGRSHRGWISRKLVDWNGQDREAEKTRTTVAPFRS